MYHIVSFIQYLTLHKDIEYPKKAVVKFIDHCLFCSKYNKKQHRGGCCEKQTIE